MTIKRTKKPEVVDTFKIVESAYFKKGDKHKITLSNPVVLIANKIKAFFRDFSGISVEFNEDDSVVYIYSTNYDMSDALNRFIVRKYEIGGLSLEVKIVDIVNGTATILDPPSYKITDEAMVKAFKTIFKHSPMAPEFTQAIDRTGTVWNFFEFPSYAIAYQADSLTNIRGYSALLIENAVKELFVIPVGYQISTQAYVREN